MTVARIASLALLSLVAVTLANAQAERPHDRAARPVVAIAADAGGTELTDFVIPHATLVESGAAEVITVAATTGPVRLRPSTMTIEPELTMAAFDAAHPRGADYVVVPALVDRASPAVTTWLRRQAALGATMVSICEGAWTLAAAGVLDGRHATSHWNALDKLATQYPRTTWVRDRRWVVDEHLVTSTGVSAALPTSLYLVERIAGRATADSVARRIGVASWEPVHHTEAFRTTTSMYAGAVWNELAWWRHDAVGVPVADGVDEIALALTLDAIPRTIRGKPYTWSATGAAVRGRQGLRLSVDRARAAVLPGDRQLPLPDVSTPPAAALDSAIARLTTWYGDGAAELIRMGMEYPRVRAVRALGILQDADRDVTR